MNFLFPSAEYCIAYVLALANLQSPPSCYSLALPAFLFWYLPVLPGLTLCLALLNIVRWSSTHTCPMIYLCLARVVPVCHWMNLACFVTKPMDKSLHMDPQVSRLVRPVTTTMHEMYYINKLAVPYLSIIYEGFVLIFLKLYSQIAISTW